MKKVNLTVLWGMLGGIMMLSGTSGAYDEMWDDEIDDYIDAPWYVSVNGGMIFFEGDEAVKEGFVGSLRLGYDYSPDWSFEGVLNYAPRLKRNDVYNYETGEPIPRRGLIDANNTAAFGAAVDALFHLRNIDNRRWDPYLIGGLGFLYFTEEREFRQRADVTLRAGAGVAYHINREWAVRGDLIGVMTVDHTEFNVMPSVGVSWRWGARVPPKYYAVGGGEWDIDVADDYDEMTTLYIEFETDKDDIRPQYFDDLDAIARTLNANPGSVARIEGHADKRRSSSHKHNMQLSERRAKAVAEYLHQYGNIARERMRPIGYGFTRPIAPNDPVHGNQLNRRVEVYIWKNPPVDAVQ